MVDWKDRGILAQIRDLERQRQRLEQLLAPDEDWQAYQMTGSDAASTSLRAKALFKARQSVIDARDALRELLGEAANHPTAALDEEGLQTSQSAQPTARSHDTPAPTGPDTIDEAPTSDAFRTRLNVKPRPSATDDDRPASMAEPGPSFDAPGLAESHDDLDLEAPAARSGASGLLTFLALSRRPAITNPAEKPANVASAQQEPLTTPEPSGPPAPTGLDSPANDDEPGRLDQIFGMEPRYIPALMANGVTNCRNIANWSAAEVARFKFLLGRGARITEDQWIEQAAILASGKTTRFARSQSNGYFAAISPTPPDRTPWVPHRYEPAARTVTAEMPRVEPQPEPAVETVIPPAVDARKRVEPLEAALETEAGMEANVRIVRTLPAAAQAVATQTARKLEPVETKPPAVAPLPAELEPPSSQRYETAAQEASVEIVRPRPRSEPELAPRPAPDPAATASPANVGKSNPISRFLRALTGD